MHTNDPSIPQPLADSPQPGSDRHLRSYWVHGEGSVRIRWNTPGDWDRCVRQLGKYVTDPKGLCAEYHHEATGEWPGKNAHKGHDGNHSADTVVAPMASDGMLPVAPVYQRPDPCEPGSHRMPDGTCMPDTQMDHATVDTAAQPGEHWRALMHVEGTSTGRRVFLPGSLDWREPPFAFHWERYSSAHNGQAEVVQVGLTTRVVRDGPNLWGFGTLDLASAEGMEYARRLVAGFARWVSIGPDEHTKPSDIAYTYADGADPAVSEPEEMVIMSGRIGELSGVSAPAQDVAVIEPTDELLEQFEVVTVAATAPRPEPEDETLTAAAHTIVIEDCPPRSWFAEPTDVERHGALTVTDQGRVFGWLAPAGVAHRSFHDRKVTVPMGQVDYTRWLGAETIVADGGRVVAGPITMDCGHADPTSRDFGARRDHYDNSCSIVASAQIGESANGVWIAGALRPGVTADQISAMMACRLSGDWQPLAGRPGWKEFVAALLVPVPGFALARTKASVTVDEDGLLVASVVPVEYAITPTVEPDWNSAVQRIAKSVNRDAATLVAAARERVGR